MNNIVKLPIGQANEKLPKVKTLPTYYDDQIVDEVEACPYCGNYTTDSCVVGRFIQRHYMKWMMENSFSQAKSEL